MIVVDASAVVELLTDSRDLRAKVATRLANEATHVGRHLDSGIFRAHFLPDTLCAPAHLDFEVAKVIRRLYVRGELTQQRAGAAMEALTGLPIRRIPLTDLLPRVWELRDNAYTGDALYLALAEDLGCPLVTTDSKLVGVPGHHANVETLT